MRIDFQFLKIERLEGYLSQDSLTKIIADKDNRMQENIEPNDRDYWQKQPTIDEIDYSAREFWRQFNNTLKANIRNEFLLAQFYLNLVRDELTRLMTWEIAFSTTFDKNYGKKNHQLQQFLPAEDWNLLTQSFDTSSKAKIFQSSQLMKHLFEKYFEKLEEHADFDLTDLKQYQTSPSSFLKSKNEEGLAKYFD